MVGAFTIAGSRGGDPARTQAGGFNALLEELATAVPQRDKQKGQLHKVFEESFDAKPIFNREFLSQKLDYIHHNPVSKKWSLVKDYTDYEHSSASFYEKGIAKNFKFAGSRGGDPARTQYGPEPAELFLR